MAESSLYSGDRFGPTIYRIGRLGFDQGKYDLGTQPYTGTFRTERVAPAGVGALVNFRRVSIHLMASGHYTMTVRIWVDDERSKLSSGVAQTVVISRSPGVLREITEEVSVEAVGSHIQVEVSVVSDHVDGVFLIESVLARGRVMLLSSGREAESI